MFSGKTEELLRRLRRASLAKQAVTLFKPERDNRHDTTDVVSHDSRRQPAHAMADAAASALDGHRINGRRIGVRDADSDDKKKKKGGRRDPEGLKLYIGNLPFTATQEQLTTMVGAHATVNEVVMATDPAGKSKGFGFAFIKDMDKGEAVVKALNGMELEGRKIKVDIAKAKAGKGGKGGRGPKSGDSDGGKSSRELQAIREEEEGGKKRKRRPRPKKD